ncbi:MAG: trimeric intracellular cation channel family protein [Weeksellaceae bacterium]|nr:trimeric intracellular cation channel family protein [Weeksellaceae bacterium]
MTDQLSYIIELAGTVAFAMSGSFAAIQHRLDPFGVLIIAFATAVGGGTVRDLLLDVPVFWMKDNTTFIVILCAAILTMIFKSIEKNFKVTLFMFDTLGLGMFTVIGIEKAIYFGANPMIAITLGTITGCFGGVLRDILVNRIPLLLRREIYATACISGGVLYFLLQYATSLNQSLIHLFTVLLIVGIRLAAVKFSWHFKPVG